MRRIRQEDKNKQNSRRRTIWRRTHVGTKKLWIAYLYWKLILCFLTFLPLLLHFLINIVLCLLNHGHQWWYRTILFDDDIIIVMNLILVRLFWNVRLIGYSVVYQVEGIIGLLRRRHTTRRGGSRRSSADALPDAGIIVFVVLVAVSLVWTLRPRLRLSFKCSTGLLFLKGKYDTMTQVWIWLLQKLLWLLLFNVQRNRWEIYH